jgi:hypothetical protein
MIVAWNKGLWLRFSLALHGIVFANHLHSIHLSETERCYADH